MQNPLDYKISVMQAAQEGKVIRYVSRFAMGAAGILEDPADEHAWDWDQFIYMVDGVESGLPETSDLADVTANKITLKLCEQGHCRQEAWPSINKEISEIIRAEYRDMQDKADRYEDLSK